MGGESKMNSIFKKLIIAMSLAAISIHANEAEIKKPTLWQKIKSAAFQAIGATGIIYSNVAVHELAHAAIADECLGIFIGTTHNAKKKATIKIGNTIIGIGLTLRGECVGYWNSPARNAISSAAGPIAGYVAAQVVKKNLEKNNMTRESHPLLHSAVEYMALVNLINLVPLESYDGGDLCKSLNQERIVTATTKFLKGAKRRALFLLPFVPVAKIFYDKMNSKKS